MYKYLFKIPKLKNTYLSSLFKGITVALTQNKISILKLLVMESKKSVLNEEHGPVKKMKVEDEKPKDKRTVATMCGAWRPEEEYGGLIFVFKQRQEALSPTPINEEDFPENIEDFWEASFSNSGEIQVFIRI